MNMRIMAARIAVSAACIGLIAGCALRENNPSQVVDDEKLSSIDYPDTKAKWVCFQERPNVEGAGQTRYFRYSFELDCPPATAMLQVLVDDGSTVFVVNGSAPNPLRVERNCRYYDLKSIVKTGRNVL